MASDEPQTGTTSASMTLLRMISGSWVSQAIHVAAKLQVADHLASGAKSSDELARAAGADADALHRLLRALASVGVFTEGGDGRFSLTPLADALRTDAPGSLRAYAIMLGEDWHWRAWGQLPHSVRTGQSAFEHVFGCGVFDYFAAHPEAAQVFNAAMTSRTGQENAAVTAAYEWPAGTIVDVGGGQGALLAAILERNPDARGVLFDVAHVVDAARPLMAEAGLAARCELVAGSFFERVPSGGDLYLLKRVLHDWTDKSALAILKNCRASMGVGSQLLVIEHVLAPGNAPSFGKLFDLEMLVLTSGGRERSDAEFRALLSAAGFEQRRIIAAGPTASLIEAIAA